MLDGLLDDVLGKGEGEKGGPAVAPAAPGTAGPPPELGPRARRLWYVEERIKATRAKLQEAEGMGERGIGRIGTLSKELREWLEELGKLAPAEPLPKEDEEARWKAAAAAAVAKIERGVREAEGTAACRKCGAACAACATT